MISKIPVLVAGTILLGAISLPAQDATQATANFPSPSARSATPAPLPSPDLSESPHPDATQSMIDLLSPSPKPNTPGTGPSPTPTPPLPELSRLDEAFKKTSIGKDADENRERVEIRVAQNSVMNNPVIVDAKHAASVARTDLEKRDRLRDYYNIYYGEIRRFVSNEDTKKLVDELKADHLKMLDQPRVRPVPGSTLPPVSEEKKAKKVKKSRLGASGG